MLGPALRAAEGEFEIRDFPGHDIELKVAKDDPAAADGVVIEMYPSITGNEDFNKDIIEPGAFKATIRERKKLIRALWQHDPDLPFGLPVEMAEDDKGLFTRTRMSENRENNENRLPLLEDGSVQQGSIGYIVDKAKLEDDEDWLSTRRIKKLTLIEYSFVTFGANPKTAGLVAIQKQLAMGRLLKSVDRDDLVGPDGQVAIDATLVSPDQIEHVLGTLMDFYKALTGKDAATDPSVLQRREAAAVPSPEQPEADEEEELKDLFEGFSRKLDEDRETLGIINVIRTRTS